jgi:hypothetical protein
MFPGEDCKDMLKKAPLREVTATSLRSSGGGVLNRIIAIAPAPVLPGDDQSLYAEMAERIVKEADPKDSIEELLIRDVIDLAWEVFRIRRLKVGILRASTATGVRTMLDELGHGPSLGFDYNRKLGQRWAAGDKSAKTEVKVALSKAGLTIDEVTAKTAEEKIETFERLDRMLASAEARRNNALREIGRHREALRFAARSAIDEIEDAEFREVESGDQSGQKS